MLSQPVTRPRPSCVSGRGPRPGSSTCRHGVASWRRRLGRGQVAKAGAAGLERPPGCGGGAWPPPLRRGALGSRCSRSRSSVRGPSRAFGLRRGSRLAARAVPPLEGETVLRSQQRRQGQPASSFFAGAGSPLGSKDGRGPETQAAEARAAAGRRTVAAGWSALQSAEELLRQWREGPAQRVPSAPPPPRPTQLPCRHGNGGPDNAWSARSSACGFCGCHGDSQGLRFLLMAHYFIFSRFYFLQSTVFKR